MLLSKTFNQPDPVFQSVVGPTAKHPPASAVDNNQPFFKSQTDPLTTSQQEPTNSTDQYLQPTIPPATHSQQPDTEPATTPPQPSHWPKTDKSGFDHSTSPVQVQQSPETDMDTDSDLDKNSVVQELTTGHYEDGELSDPEKDISVNDVDQSSTEEQNYRGTMRGVHSHMGWTHILDIDTFTSRAEDNPFAAPKQQPVGKVSVTLPTDDWLYRKMDGLNLTLTQGYPSRSSEAGGLQRDKFIKYNKSQAK